jgi:hypothetical protein
MNLEKLFTDKNISSSSKNLYIKNLTRLNGGEIKNVNFLKDLDSVQKISRIQEGRTLLPVSRYYENCQSNQHENTRNYMIHTIN